MIKKINNTERIESEAKNAGRTTHLNEQKHLDAITEMNKTMEEVRRDYKIKSKNSEISASKIILTS